MVVAKTNNDYRISKRVAIFMFPGYWNPNNKKFNNIGKRTNCWLADGDNIELNTDKMNHNNNNPEFGFSLRLLKNWNPAMQGKYKLIIMVSFYI